MRGRARAKAPSAAEAADIHRGTDAVAKKSTKKSSAKKSAKSAKKAVNKKTTKKSAPKATKKTAKKTVKRSDKKTSAKGPKKSPAKATARTGNPASARAKLKSPLTKKQLAEFRQKLLEKRRDLLGDMNAIEHTALGSGRGNGSGDLMPTHPADLGSDNYEQEFTLGLLESERTLLKEIHEALERIDDGIYGVCVGTAKPIGLPRLNARPWAKYCIEYARMVEKGLIRPGETLFDDEDDGEEE